MIVFVNPRATRTRHRRFPLSVMALGAALPPEINWTIVDGNRPVDPAEETIGIVKAAAGTNDPVRLIAVTAMPGPQLFQAVSFSKRIRNACPGIPIVWGGYFPSLYPEPVLNAEYVDYAVRGQGEQTLVELLQVVEGNRDPSDVRGLAYRSDNGNNVIGRERSWVGPAELPPPPYHAIDVADYLRPSNLGSRSGVYQSSIGCPYKCNFCGVISAFGSRQVCEPPERTAGHIGKLVREFGMDSVHFYDNNFFLAEDRAIEMAERLTPLNISWWCEARVDAVLRYSDDTLRRLRQSGLRMVFFGAESGSDRVLAEMSKQLTTDKIVEVAARTRDAGIIPEFSFVFGNPRDPEGDTDDTLRFVRRLKKVNPQMELVTYFYTPTPQRGTTYGDVDAASMTPTTLEDWLTEEWLGWMTHDDPKLSWLSDATRQKVEDFRIVLQSRFPSVHDTKTRPWGKAIASVAARSRWTRSHYHNPRLLRAIRRAASVAPDDPQEYGHLRPPV